MQKPTFTHKLLIYIPSYNVAERIIGVIDEIPESLWEIADVMVIDNHSTDGTFDRVLKGNEEKRWKKQVFAIQPETNLGYSGSQKLAYKMAIDSNIIESVVMLHGDGQYDPNMIIPMLKYVDSDYEVIYGYRSWTNYFGKDETPISSYITIKVLSFIESLISGIFRKEWHSGFVMYKTKFLKRVNFANITKTMHIDGHLLFASGKLGVPVKALPIYKRYKNYPALGKTARVKYVFDVLAIIPKLHFISVANKSEAESEVENASQATSVDSSAAISVD